MSLDDMANGPQWRPLVALVTAHKASKQPRTEHRYGDAMLRVVQATPSALVVGREGEHVGGAA